MSELWRPDVIAAFLQVITIDLVLAADVFIYVGALERVPLLPLEALVQIGATVAIGVLLDTFVVRALTIPAITWLCGERAWWPSRSRRAQPKSSG